MLLNSTSARTVPSALYFDNTPIALCQNDQDVIGPGSALLMTVRKVVRSVRRIISVFLRDNFLFPLNRPDLNKACNLLHSEASEFVSRLTIASDNGRDDELKTVRKYFSISDSKIYVDSDNVSFVFNTRIVESKKPINGKSLRFVLFSFYGHKQITNNKETDWKPLNVQDQALGPLLVMRALKKNGVKLDSIITNSMGNIIISEFDSLSIEDKDLIPGTLIINRGLTSIKKAIIKLYTFPMRQILDCAVRISGWAADPETALINFLNDSAHHSPLKSRKIILIEALRDHYFSNEGGFDPNFHRQLEATGAKVFRGQFYPACLNERAHHAAPLDYLTNNFVSKIYGKEAMKIEDYESVSDSIARNIFLEGTAESHTNLYVGGNLETLDMATRGIYPLLASAAKSH